MIDKINVVRILFVWWNRSCGFDHVQAKTYQPLDCDTIGVLVTHFCQCKDVKVMILHYVVNVVDFIIYGANV